MRTGPVGLPDIAADGCLHHYQPIPCNGTNTLWLGFSPDATKHGKVYVVRVFRLQEMDNTSRSNIATKASPAKDTDAFGHNLNQTTVHIFPIHGLER